MREEENCKVTEEEKNMLKSPYQITILKKKEMRNIGQER